MGAAVSTALDSALAQNASGVNQVDTVAGGVYFHQGDIEGHGHCNNGWIVFKDYVLVIDANFPSGAQTVLPKIRAITRSRSGLPLTRIIMATTLTAIRFGSITEQRPSHIRVWLRR